MAAYHVFVLPAVFVLGPALADRELDGASSWAIIVACFGVGTIIGNVLALRAPVRRPVLVAACALVVGSTQAVIIGSGLGTAGHRGCSRWSPASRSSLVLHALGHVASRSRSRPARSRA